MPGDRSSILSQPAAHEWIDDGLHGDARGGGDNGPLSLPVGLNCAQTAKASP